MVQLCRRSICDRDTHQKYKGIYYSNEKISIKTQRQDPSSRKFAKLDTQFGRESDGKYFLTADSRFEVSKRLVATSMARKLTRQYAVTRDDDSEKGRYHLQNNEIF